MEGSIPYSAPLITGDGNVVSFALLCTFVIHQATQNLNYGPVLQSQGHQSMSIGTALFTLWFPVLVFHNLVGCFTRPGLVFGNKPTVLFKLVFGGKSASLASAAALLC